MNVNVFSILDGHGGLQVVSHIKDHLPSFILEYLNGLSLTPTQDIIKKKF